MYENNKEMDMIQTETISVLPRSLTLPQIFLDKMREAVQILETCSEVLVVG